MTYSVKETYYTIQGEGAHTGRPAVFLRFAGCNLWSGREQDRDNAVCRFCDTQFVGVDGPGGGKFETAEALAAHVRKFWPDSDTCNAYVVCTGGEPLLQLDPQLIDALHRQHFEIGVESNGTLEAPTGIDWLCISPKANARLVQRSGDELKLVFPQPEAEAYPQNFEGLDFKHFFLQPMDNDKQEENTRSCIEFCMRHPSWKLSLQSHKYIGID